MSAPNSKAKNIELLTKDECEIILQRSLGTKKFQLISYRIENGSENNIGFLGDYFRLIVVAKTENDNIQTDNFFIKTLPAEGSQRNFLKESGVFEKETIIYEKLLRNFSCYSNKKWRPECYYTRPDLLVLEDLYVQNYYHIPKNKEFTEFDVKTSLRALATLHASSIAYELDTKINIGEKFKDVLFETSVDKSIDWFLTGVRALSDVALLHPRFQSQKYKDFLKNDLMNKISPVYEMVQPSKKYRNVLCHRDCWGRNIFFNKIGDAVSSVLVDYQICRYCPPAIDVLFCIYLNTRRKNRYKILSNCLEWYYERLKEDLKSMEIDIENHLTWKDFLKSCDELKLMPLIYYGIMFTVVYLPSDLYFDSKNNDPEKFYYYANVNRSELVMDQLQKDANYKNEIFEAVEELVDYLCTL